MAEPTETKDTGDAGGTASGGAARAAGASGFRVVGAVLVLLMLSSSVPSALYVLYQQEWGLSSGVITVVFAVYAVTVLAGLLLFGSLSDTLGRRPVLAASLVLAIVSMGLFAGAGGSACCSPPAPCRGWRWAWPPGRWAPPCWS